MNEQEHQEKARVARKKVEVALRNGALIRPGNCSSCGRMYKPMAHHPDYDKPLVIEWLCRSCHNKVHGNKEAFMRKTAFIARELLCI